MKKILCLILALIFISSTCLAANVNIEYNRDTLELTISGNASKGAKLLTVAVTAPNIEWSQVDSAASPVEKLAKLSYFSQIRTGSDGAYSFTYKVADVPADSSAAYSARVYDETSDLMSYSDKIICYGATAISNALTAVNNAGTISLMEKAITDGSKALGIKTDELSGFSKGKKDFVFGYILENKTYATCEDVCLSFDNAVYLSKIKYCEDIAEAANLLLSQGASLGFDDTCAFDIYSSDAIFTSSLRQAVAKDMQNADNRAFYSAASLKELFAKCVILNGCYNNKWSSVDTILKTAKPLDSYELTTFNKTKDTSAVCKYINKTKYSSLQDLANAVESYLKNPVVEDIKQPSPSSPVSAPSYSASLPAQSAPVQDAPAPELPFTDMDDYAWALDAVGYLYSKNIISGKSETVFDPASSVKREEFAKMISIALGLTSTSVADFADVNSVDWYYYYTNAVHHAGIMIGDANGNFGVGNQLKRQDVALILYRAIGSPDAGDNNIEFTDYDLIDSYAKKAIQCLSSMGIINGMGDGSFGPHLAVTRAQAAKLVYEIITR